MAAPRPKDTTPPVWLFMSSWTAYKASTHVCILHMPSAPNVTNLSSVPRRYSNVRFSFDQSCSVLQDTRVHRKAMGSWMSSLPRFET
jgi:hypothetical protein